MDVQSSSLSWATKCLLGHIEAKARNSLFANQCQVSEPHHCSYLMDAMRVSPSPRMLYLDVSGSRNSCNVKLAVTSSDYLDLGRRGLAIQLPRVFGNTPIEFEGLS